MDQPVAAGQPVVPAPWRLRGNGYILILKYPRQYLQPFLPEALAPRFAGGLSLMMLVDYQQSDAGPYQELLFIPGRFRATPSGAGRAFYAITQIHVSTLSSVVNGRRNWGIPKERADFELQTTGAGQEAIIVRQGAQQLANFVLQSFGPALPVTTAVVPAALRTLMQPYEGQTYFTIPSGRGLVRPARLVDSGSNPAQYPDPTQARAVSVVRVKDFHLRFPVAHVGREAQHAA